MHDTASTRSPMSVLHSLSGGPAQMRSVPEYAKGASRSVGQTNALVLTGHLNCNLKQAVGVVANIT